MYQSPVEILQQYLQDENITPQKLAQKSGMPFTEVRLLLKGQLDFTALRANHLAAVFNTESEIWLHGRRVSKNVRTIQQSLV